MGTSVFINMITVNMNGIWAVLLPSTISQKSGANSSIVMYALVSLSCDNGMPQLFETKPWEEMKQFF